MTDSTVLDAYPFIHNYTVETEASAREADAFDIARDMADRYMEDDNRKYEVICYASVEASNVLKQWHFSIKVLP